MARRWWELHSYIGSLKKIAKTVTREQDAAVRRRHMDVPSANNAQREEKAFSLVTSLLLHKESYPLAEGQRKLLRFESFHSTPSSESLSLLVQRK